MLIEIHMIQNHSPANLNRDDLGAPKTCYFGGVLRSRISSQCIKRSIRMSDEFEELLGGVRTRQLAKLVAKGMKGDPFDEHLEVDAKDLKRTEKILSDCGFKPKDEDKSKMLVYTTREAVGKMVDLVKSAGSSSDMQLAMDFASLISSHVFVPDMALSGRMLEPSGFMKGVWDKLGTTVEASLQVAHAISTHEARPEVDYYVAADDIPGQDAGAGYVDEAMFASACFYKYFSIHWETLVGNLGGQHELAAHTVGAFIRGAARVNPTGKQNSFAAHNLPDGMLVEIKNTPISYANAFASPVVQGERNIISQSVAQLGQYVH
ncbi:MAG: type I-E CRISPR-associated protein Cas7/Cse4/CasC, partial [bacterium]